MLHFPPSVSADGALWRAFCPSRLPCCDNRGEPQSCQVPWLETPAKGEVESDDTRRRDLLQRHRQRACPRPSSRRGCRGGEGRGPLASRGGVGLGADDLAKPVLGTAPLPGGRGARGDARRPRLGRGDRLRDTDPVRQRRSPTEAVHRSGRGPLQRASWPTRSRPPLRHRKRLTAARKPPSSRSTTPSTTGG